MRKDEIYALNSLAAHYGGTWEEGEDPPDGYLTIRERIVAVEISTLIQHVIDERGAKSRYSDDVTAVRLVDALNSELKHLIPDDRRIVLALSSPVNDYRKTKDELAAKIMEIVADSSSDPVKRKVSIRGSSIGISTHVSHGEGKKIVGAVMNRSSSPNILKNAIYILEDRICVKAKKCSELSFCGPIWLALINDYFLADADTYSRALQSISADHPFEKILLISDKGSVDVLLETAA